MCRILEGCYLEEGSQYKKANDKVEKIQRKASKPFNKFNIREKRSSSVFKSEGEDRATWKLLTIIKYSSFNAIHSNTYNNDFKQKVDLQVRYLGKHFNCWGSLA